MLISWHYASFLHHYLFQWIESWCYEWWRSHIAQSPPHKAWSQILNSPVLLKVKWVGDSGLMNDRIALISHWLNSSALVSHLSSFIWTVLSFVFDLSLLVCARLSFVFTCLHSSRLVCHLSTLILSLVCNISNQLVFRLNLRSAFRQKIMNWP